MIDSQRVVLPYGLKIGDRLYREGRTTNCREHTNIGKNLRSDQGGK